jgi:UTP:GlnB (protein PII) uridylyltransferase
MRAKCKKTTKNAEVGIMETKGGIRDAERLLIIENKDTY